MNNKGFTVVELLASFALTMVIMVFLFEIVLQLKEVYVTNALKTKILDKNAIVATTLNDKLEGMKSATCILDDFDDQNEDIAKCKTLQITLSDDSTISIETITDDASIKIGNQTIKYPKNVEKILSGFEKYPRNVSQTGDNVYIKINYLIKSGYLDNNIEFNYVYSYKSS